MVHRTLASQKRTSYHPNRNLFAGEAPNARSLENIGIAKIQEFTDASDAKLNCFPLKPSMNPAQAGQVSTTSSTLTV